MDRLFRRMVRPRQSRWLAMMTGQPLVGLGIEDLLAALDTRLGEVIVEGGLTSYEAVARVPIHRRVMVGVVPEVLGRYDLPDLAASSCLFDFLHFRYRERDISGFHVFFQVRHRGGSGDRKHHGTAVQ
jgi:hypothetical protein